MSTFKTTTTILPDGTIELTKLPFTTGQVVEVNIEPVPAVIPPDEFPLRGSVLRYESPTDPVARRN